MNAYRFSMIRSRWTCLLSLLILLLLGVGLVARAGEGYDISWWTVDGGGGASTGGHYVLRGTAAQPDAGLLKGGDYSLYGGFWRAEPAGASWEVFLPLVLRDH
jgi:hypothetical protein